MSFRVLIFIILVGIILLWLRKQIQNFFREINGGEAQDQTAKPPRQIETMVPCSHCHTHILPSEAVYVDGDPYCSQEHIRLHRKDS